MSDLVIADVSNGVLSALQSLVEEADLPVEDFAKRIIYDTVAAVWRSGGNSP